ncbi:MAG: hypothetical protein WD556_09795 [Actinomycetota bacterium]
MGSARTLRPRPSRRRRIGRRIERWVLGIGMTIVAVLLERRVLRGIKRRGEAPPPRHTLGDNLEQELLQDSTIDISEPGR